MKVYRNETNIMNEGELYPRYHRSQAEAYKVAQLLLKEKLNQWREHNGIKRVADIEWGATITIYECELRKRPAKEAYVSMLNGDERPFRNTKPVREWTPRRKWRKVELLQTISATFGGDEPTIYEKHDADGNLINRTVEQ